MMPLKQDTGNTEDLVAVEEMRDDAVLLKDGSLRQIIIVGGVNFALKSETEQNILTQSYQNFLNSMDFPLQIVVHSRKINVERYLEELARYQAEEPSPLLKNQAGEYSEFIRGFVRKNAIMEKSFFVVVPFTPVRLSIKNPIPSFLSFFGKKKNPLQEQKSLDEKEKNFQEGLAQLKQRVNQALEGLLAIGLEATVLNNEQLIELFYNFYNPERVEREKMNLPTGG